MQRGNIDGHNIRLPINVREKVMKWRKAQFDFMAENMRRPTPEEIADALGMSESRYDKLEKVMGINRMVSIDDPMAVKLNRRRGMVKDDTTTLHNLLQSESNVSEKLIAEEFQSAIAEMVSELPATEASVLIHRYGLDGRGERSIAQISSDLSLSPYMVYKMHRDGIERLLSTKRAMLELFRENLDDVPTVLAPPSDPRFPYQL